MLRYWWNQLKSPKTLYIIRGLPGAGKSTVAAALTPWNVAADDYPGLYSPSGLLNLELQSLSHQWCFAQVEKMLQRGRKKVAVHNTFTQLKYIEPYITLAEQYGYRVQIVHCEGNHGNIHNVPPEVMSRMKSSWEPFPFLDFRLSTH